MCLDLINKYSCGCETVVATKICSIGKSTQHLCQEKKPGLGFSKRLRRWFDRLDSAIPLNPTQHQEEEQEQERPWDGASRANWRKRCVNNVGVLCEKCLSPHAALKAAARRQRSKDWKYRLAKERHDALLQLCRATSKNCIGKYFNELSRELRIDAAIACEEAGRQLEFAKKVAVAHALAWSHANRCQDDNGDDVISEWHVDDN